MGETSRQHLAQAAAQYQRGEQDAALATFQALIQAQPANAQALNGAAICLMQLGRVDEARQQWQAAIAADPQLHPAHYCLGALHEQAGEADAAVACYQRAVAAAPDFADGWNSLGNLLKTQKRLPEAEQALREAMRLRPGNAVLYNNLGNVLLEQGQTTEAEIALRESLRLNPDFAQAPFNLANLFMAQGRHEEALPLLQRALMLQPNFAESHVNLGNLHKDLKNYDKAIVCYRRAIESRPDMALAHLNLGHVCLHLKQYAEAEQAYRKALALPGDAGAAWYGLGNLLAQRGLLSEAEVAYQQALALKPDFADAWNNLAVLLKDQRRFAEAEAGYRRALALNPDLPDGRMNLGMLLLTLGRYEEGWALYESRVGAGRDDWCTPPALPCPRWQGEDLRGKSLLIWFEQGYGDQIQFLRFIPQLRERCLGRLTLVCKPVLKRLFQQSLFAPLIDQLLSEPEARSRHASLASHDFWVFPLSLPLYLGLRADNIPAPLPYLNVDPERARYWTSRLHSDGQRRIGLVWKGSSINGNDAWRSLPDLQTLAPLWQLQGVHFISLQKGQGEAEARFPPPGQPLLALGSQMEDFADAAAIVSQLDLLISVDTAIAHLAGALNKACWVLLPRIGRDWRWGDERDDSPWYPGALRLFRQNTPGDWTEVVSALVKQWGKQWGSDSN